MDCGLRPMSLPRSNRSASTSSYPRAETYDVIIEPDSEQAYPCLPNPMDALAMRAPLRYRKGFDARYQALTRAH